VAEATRAIVARTWGQRYEIETQASVRFAHLSRRLSGVGAPAALSELARQASTDEARHAVHCQTMVARFGGVPQLPVPAVLEYAPRRLTAPQRVLYDVVAQCCVAETQSMGTLVTL